MAESIVLSVITQLVPLVAELGTSQRGISKKLRVMKDELESIRSFLKDADERAAEDVGQDDVKTWVRRLRAVAYRIEDAIDKYMVLQLRPVSSGLCLSPPVLLLIHLPQRHKIAGVFADLEAEVSEINSADTGILYNLIASDNHEHEASVKHRKNEGSSSSWGDPRVCFLFTEESELVNIDTPTSEIKKLLDLDLQDPRRSVISIVGMGGLGKTTLARKVYNDKAIRKHFPIRAWVTVSQTYSTLNILETLVKHFRKAVEDTPALPSEHLGRLRIRTTKASLIEELREYLEEKRYLAILDDVWDVELWKYIDSALPYNVKGSKIIITTRLESVASTRNPALHHQYDLKHLSSNVAWNLFCDRAFGHDSGVCPKELEILSRGIVRKCGGLPLAIVAIRRLLSTKDMTVSVWQKLHDSLGYELGNNPHLKAIKRILSLSYHGLPYYLKPCFLYFSIFPEDYPISRKRLIRLWIAEGFIPEVIGKTLEDIAEEFLTELLYRNLIQVTSTGLNGEAKSVQVHDLMREVILSIGDDMRFSQAWHPVIESCFADNFSRRLTIRGDVDKVIKSIQKSHVRSLFLFHIQDSSHLSGKLFKKMKLLKVLDFEGAPLDQIPKEIGILLHLKYLNLRRTNVKSLPKTIGNLFNLQTLDLKHSDVTELPVEIGKLRKLRHLIVYKDEGKQDHNSYKRRGATIPVGVLKQLKELQSLSFVVVEVDELIEELRNLRGLRKLGISIHKTQSQHLSSVLNTLGQVFSLRVTSKEEGAELDLFPLNTPLLFNLYLDGKMVGEKLSKWIKHLKNLSRLHLRHSSLVNDPIRILKLLPNLVELWLDGAYDGKYLSFEANWFPKLKALHMLKLHNLEMLRIECGSIPLLENLRIGPSPKMKSVPSGVKHLKLLKALEFIDMPPEFMDHIHPGIGPSYCIVEHIPSICSRRWQETRFKSYALPRNWERTKFSVESGRFFTPPPSYLSAMKHNNQAAPIPPFGRLQNGAGPSSAYGQG